MRRAYRHIRLRGIALIAAAVAVALSLLPSPNYGATATGPAYLPTTNSYPAPSQIQNSKLKTQSSAEAAPVSTRSSNSVYYRQTAHYIKDAFLNHWLMNGGVAIYGYPISEEFTQDGVPMQYFERARFEYRPNSARPWKVELTNVGSLLTQGRAFPRQAIDTLSADRTLFQETGYTLGGAFGQF